MTSPTTTAVPLPGREVRHEHAHRDRQDWWVPIFRGGWLLIVGAFALYSPPTTLFALSMFFATAIFISAGVLLTNGIALRSSLPIAQGILSMGIAAIVAFTPQSSWQVIVFAVALWAIAMGVIDIMVVRRHHHVRGHSFLLAAGAISIVAGLLGLAAPAFALPVSAFGVLALIAGGSLVGFGMRRRRRSGHTSAASSAHRDEEHREHAHV